MTTGNFKIKLRPPGSSSASLQNGFFETCKVTVDGLRIFSLSLSEVRRFLIFILGVLRVKFSGLSAFIIIDCYLFTYFFKCTFFIH